ncbi:unnamed protein product [Rangifer tarandus platyrhynchus]|uniref:Uncharacterized protein n=1 Tax=Rangifer tarandus platyrhynchus TaxID=3082113 RepID=A0AC59YBF3_RANTA
MLKHMSTQVQGEIAYDIQKHKMLQDLQFLQHGFVSPGGTSQDLSRLLLHRQQEKDEKGRGEGGVDEHSLQAGKGRGQRASAEPP